MEKTLQEIFPELWGENEPKNLSELVQADWAGLTETGKALRKLAVDLVFSFERKPVHTAGVARKMLEDHHLPSTKGKWCAIALDEKRERNYLKGEKGSMRLNHAVSAKFFDYEKLRQKAPLPENGKYLFIYGGSPEALSEGDTAERIISIKSYFNVADIIFWDTSSEAALFYSVGAGVGQKGNDQIQFPDPDILERVRAQ